MKNIIKICEKIYMLFYILFLYQVWHLCQYADVIKHFPLLLISGLGFLIGFVFRFTLRKRETEDSSVPPDTKMKKRFVIIERIVALAVTIFFIVSVIYSAFPYHGALSWKVNDFFHKREITLTHNNFFEDGADGVLADLGEAFSLPSELYIVNDFHITFDEAGMIQTLGTFIYGKDENGKTETYQVDYNADQSEKMTVLMYGEADSGYDEEMRLEPMLRILEEAGCRQQVEEWAKDRGAKNYEVVYYGYRSFSQADGLKYLPGDVNGDGTEQGVQDFEQLSGGGEITGYEVSLHIPGVEEVIPVRYIMEPVYISREELE